MSEPAGTEIHPEYLERFESHFMLLVNIFRGDGATDDLIRVCALLARIPEWMVLRVGHDMRKLTPEQEERYRDWIKKLG